MTRRGADIPRVLIIGGGFGGLSAARALRRAAVEVTVVDRSNHHLFQALLYQVAMAGLSPADIAYPIRTALAGQRNSHVVMGEVRRVELEARRVELTDGTSLEYDYVVIAAGAKSNYFGRDAEWGPLTYGLKTLDDATALRRQVLLAFEAAEREPDPSVRRRLLTFVVVGGGPTGVELAGALSELGRFVLAADYQQVTPQDVRVVLVEAQDRVLTAFTAELSRAAERQLRELGVEVRTSTRVEEIAPGSVRLGAELVETQTVMWTAGVKARGLAQAVGTELDRAGRIVVGDDCSIPGHPEAFAIGDIASFVPPGAKEPLPGLAPVAIQQGHYVARTIRSDLAGRARAPFAYFDKGIMATVGRSRAVAQSGPLRFSGFIAWIAWLFIHIWYLIGFRNRVSVFLTWVWSYVTYRRGARLITGEQAWHQVPKLLAAARGEVPEEPLEPPSRAARDAA